MEKFEVKEYEVIVINWGKFSEACLFGFFSVSLCLRRERCPFPPGTGRVPLP